jgi:DNA-binding transcriptional ArsR family regulator
MHAFAVLADPVRRSIVEILRRGEHASGEIVEIVGEEFGIGQSAVSQHLKILRENGFANVTVSGARRIYELDAAPLSEVDQWLAPFRHYWGPKLKALATEVARGKRKKRGRKKGVRLR